MIETFLLLCSGHKQIRIEKIKYKIIVHARAPTRFTRSLTTTRFKRMAVRKANERKRKEKTFVTKSRCVSIRFECNERIRLKWFLVWYVSKGRAKGRVAPAKGPTFRTSAPEQQRQQHNAQYNNATKYLFYEDFKTEAVLLRFSSNEILVE